MTNFKSLSNALLRTAVAPVVALALLAGTASASVIYNVTVDTSDPSVSGTSGFLDFQFNPGNATSQAATAQIHLFSGGTLVPAPSVVGSVSGTLPGDVTFTNSTALNEYFEQFTFGTSFSFQLILSGPAIDSPNGTSSAGTLFGLGLYDASQNPILTNQGATTGFAGKVDILLTGGTQPTLYPNGTAPTIATFAQVAAVPEPATFALFGLSLLGVVLRRRLASRRPVL